MATKLALGYRLWELPNVNTGRTKAAFEPVLDYIVIKIPRFTFEKFPGGKGAGHADEKRGRSHGHRPHFPEALQKGLRSLEEGHDGFSGAMEGKLDLARLREHLLIPGPERIFWLYHALKAGHTVEELHRLTKITEWFLREMEEIVILEGRLRGFGLDRLPGELLEKAKRAGFSDGQIAACCGAVDTEVKARRHSLSIHPVFKRVDTCSGEFEAETPYLYSTWEYGQEGGDGGNEAPPSARKKAIVLGSGPNRIGQGVEFDCCCVQAVEAIRSAGVDASLINCNPETVSTDFETSDRLYSNRSPMTRQSHVRREANGVPASRNSAVKLLETVGRLHAEGVPLLGTSHQHHGC